ARGVPPAGPTRLRPRGRFDGPLASGSLEIMGPRMPSTWRLVRTVHAPPPPIAGPRGRLRRRDAPGPADPARTRPGRSPTRSSRRRDGTDHVWNRRDGPVLVVQWEERSGLPRLLGPVGRLARDRRRMAVG